MKKFWCGAVIPNCNARFEGKSEDDIMAQVARHAERDHGIRDIPASVIQQVRASIQEV